MASWNEIGIAQSVVHLLHQKLFTFLESLEDGCWEEELLLTFYWRYSKENTFQNHIFGQIPTKNKRGKWKRNGFSKLRGQLTQPETLYIFGNVTTTHLPRPEIKHSHGLTGWLVTLEKYKKEMGELHYNREKLHVQERRRTRLDTTRSTASNPSLRGQN